VRENEHEAIGLARLATEPVWRRARGRNHSYDALDQGITQGQKVSVPRHAIAYFSLTAAIGPDS
jgi:hypothetical protein